VFWRSFRHVGFVYMVIFIFEINILHVRFIWGNFDPGHPEEDIYFIHPKLIITQDLI